MNLVEKFNSLNETTVNRKTLEYLLARAKKEQNLLIQSRIVKVLKQYNDNEFRIQIVSLVEPYGLNGLELDLFDFDELNEPQEAGLNGIPQQEIYDLVTNKIIENLEDSEYWDNGQVQTGTYLTAFNFKTKKPYRGINQMLLGGNPLLGTFLENPYYLTFKQVEELGGTITKGAKSLDAIFYTIIYDYKGFKTNDKDKFIDHLRSTGDFADEEIMSAVFAYGYGIIRVYNVFNGKDIENIDFKLPPVAPQEAVVIEKIDICEKIINKYPAPKPLYKIGGKQPYYQPNGDFVMMPKVEVYKDIRTYYAVFFHELIHSTGAKNRLNRKFGKKNGDNNYAFEELVAEIGASFLSATSGFFYFTKDNAKSYINSWRKGIVAYLKENNKGIFMASAKAQKAVDFMLTNITEEDFKTTAKIEVKKVQTPTKPTNKVVTKSKKNTKPVAGSKKDLEENVKGFDLSKNTESNALMQAITDICILDKNEKFFNQYRFVYNAFYLRNGNKFIKNQIVILDDLKALRQFKVIQENDLYTFEVWDNIYEFSILKEGKNLINRINHRLKSLENQKYNYSFFDGLKGVEIENNLFNKSLIKAIKKGIKPNDGFVLGFPNGELKNYIENFEISLSGKVLLKAIAQTKDHNLNFGNFIDLPKFINNPIAIFKSKTKGVVVLTEIKDINNKSVIIALHINKTRKSSKIASMYVRENENTYKNWINEGLNLYVKKESDLFTFTQAIIAVGETNSLSNNKDNKNNTNIQNTPEKGLKAVAKRNNLANKMANRKTNFEYFSIDNADLSEFLGQIEKKEKESIVISLTGGQGSMKTRFAFQFMNALAQNYNVGHASIEEHPESKLYYDKVEQYLNTKALNNIVAPEVKNVTDLDILIKNNDVIIIDSYAKMQELEKGFEVDKDLRKKYDGKLFLVIFQQTTDGKMRGGSKSQFDADIVLFTEKKEDYKNNYVYADKNRYQNKSLDQLKFNIYNGILLPIKTEINNEIKPTEIASSVFSFNVN